MKFEIDEGDNTTNIWLTPETVAEVSILARLGMNRLKQPADISVNFNKDGTCTGVLVFPTATLPRSELK